MRWTRRFSYLTAVVASAVTVLGLAGPAEATYSPQPLTLGWHPLGPVHSSVSANGVVYVGGKLDGTGGIAAVAAGTGNLLWQIPANGDVRALTLSPDGSRLFAGGAFSTVNGVTKKHLVAINTADHTLVSPWKGTASGMVRDLVVSGDNLFVGGTFAQVDGVASKGIAAVSAATGTRLAAFNHTADLAVEGLALTSTSLLMVGKFTQVDGQARASLASIDLSTFALTSWAPHRFCSGCDTYWDVQTDGTWAYVGASGSGGNFAAISLTTGQVRWAYVHADGDIQSVWLAGEGKAYVGGHFGQTIYNTATRGNAIAATVVAAVDLTTGQPDPSFTPRIYKLYPGCWTFTSTSGALRAGGDFTGEQQNGANNHKPYLAAYPVL
jgi:hypothetical protein